MLDRLTPHPKKGQMEELYSLLSADLQSYLHDIFCIELHNTLGVGGTVG